MSAPKLSQDQVDQLVSGLDAYMAQRRRKQHAEFMARWEANPPSHEQLYRVCQGLLEKDESDRPPDWPSDVVDPDEQIRLEEFHAAYGGRRGVIAEIAEKARLLSLREAALADAEAGIRRRPYKPPMVRSANKPAAPVGPKPDPSAPKVAERTGRRGAAPLVVPGSPEEDAFWVKAMVLRFNPRDYTGAVRIDNGKEFPLGSAVLMRSGLVTLIVGMRCECRITGGEVEIVKSAWH
jgi:hypothetical protein